MSEQEDQEDQMEIPEYGIYEGERDQESGKRNGHGKNMFGNGDLYEGQYSMGKKHGKGIYTFANSHGGGGVGKYSGSYVYGKRTGQGKFEYPDKSYYEGDFVDGKREGKGKYVYPNGDYFEGDWKNDLKQGQGTYTFQSSSIKKEGMWVDDKLKGMGKIKMAQCEFQVEFESSDKIKNETNVPVTFLQSGYSTILTDPSLISRLSHVETTSDPLSI